MSTVTDASTPSRTRYVRGNPITAAAMISSLQSSHSGMYLCFSQCGGSDKRYNCIYAFHNVGSDKRYRERLCSAPGFPTASMKYKLLEDSNPLYNSMNILIRSSSVIVARACCGLNITLAVDP